MRRPNAGGFTLSIDEDFTETQNYPVKLYDMDEGPSTFPGAKAGSQMVTWKFNVYREDGTAFMNPSTGEVFEVWAFSSDSTFGTSKGRGYIEALMGGPMSDDEIDALIDAGLKESLLGKTALASFEVQNTADGNERLKLALLRPRRRRAETVGATTPSANSAARTVTVTELPRQQPRLDD